MKRRTVNNAARAMRKPGDKPSTQSRYGKKVARGNQMYGPGCYAHTTVAKRVHLVVAPNLTREEMQPFLA